MTEHSSAEFLRRAAEARSRIREEPAEVALRTDQENQILVDVPKSATVVCYGNAGNRGALAADALRVRPVTVPESPSWSVRYLQPVRFPLKRVDCA